MSTNVWRKLRVRLRTLLEAGAGILLLSASTASHAGAVVVSKDSPIDAMDADQVKRVFLGRESKINGSPVMVLYQRDEANRTEFETKVLGRTGAALSSYWAALIFTGKAMPPDEVNGGDAGVRAKLQNNPNAIGYVTDAGVDSTVKIIFKY